MGLTRDEMKARHADLVEDVRRVVGIAQSEGLDEPRDGALADRIADKLALLEEFMLQHAAPPPPLDSGHG